MHVSRGACALGHRRRFLTLALAWSALLAVVNSAPVVAIAQEVEFAESESWFDPGHNFWPAGNGSLDYYPTYDFHVDVLLLDRQGTNDRTFLYDNAAAPLLSSGDLNLPTDGGVRVHGLVMDPDGWELELGFFTLGRNTRAVDFSSANGVNLFPSVPSSQLLTYAQHTSRVYGGEINLRRRLLPQIALLGGLRLATMEESFAVATDVTSAAAATGATDNDLFGFQLGLETMLLSRHWVHLIGSMKYGVCHNRAEFNFAGTNLLTGSAASASLVNNGAATIGEALAGLEFPLGPHASIRLGYQVLWFQGVALAVDQDYLALMSGGVDVAQAMAIYQGGFIGFEAAF